MATSDDLKQRLSAAATEGDSEFAMALLVSEVIDAQFDAAEIRLAFTSLIEPLTQLQSPVVEDLLAFFSRVGFGGATPERMDLSHSNLQWVLSQRHGLPIAIAALLIEAARCCSFSAHGINFPGHFLVSVQNEIVDPLSLTVLRREQIAQRVDADELAKLTQPTQTRVFGLRMLNNVKIQYAQAGNWTEVLDILACQLLVETVDLPSQAALHFERGECLQRLSMQSHAERAYRTCIEMSPPTEVLLQAQQRLHDLEFSAKILH